MTRSVAVVGAGIAGPAAVLALAKAGLRVHWIAPRPDPDHDPIGETLAPAANPILFRLGLSDMIERSSHRRSHTTLSAWGSPQLIDRNAILHLEGPGLVLDRRRFEADLRSAAAAVSNPVSDARLADARADGGVWHLTTEAGETFTADALVDASGRNAVVARHHAERRRTDRLAAAHAFLTQHDNTVEPTPAVLIEAVADGWWYAALRPDGTLSVAYFCDPDLMAETPSRDIAVWKHLISGTRYIGRWIDDAGFAVDAPPRMSSAGTTWMTPPAGRVGGAPWMAVGDSAAAFDPLSSHGMTTALWAAEQSGTVIPAALECGNRDEALGAYAGSVLDGVQRFLEQRRQMYAMERRFAESGFWRRRHTAQAEHSVTA
ncbi:MAG: glycine oxidase maturase GoxB [Thalassobaculaceae bacterium]|nr:glycine oxidase maturase GoxB [Thalassobaculaceae bacterium]